MKRFVQVLAALMLAAASFGAVSALTESDMLGRPAQASSALRTVLIGPRTPWVTVERGDVVRFVSNGREFVWAFDGLSSSFDLGRIAPAGTVDRRLMVYVWPNAQDLEDK